MDYRKGRQIIESTALNKVKKMFHPLYKFKYDEYDRESSGTEQKYYAIQSIFEDMHRQLKKLKEKHDRWMEDKKRGAQEKKNNFTS